MTANADDRMARKPFAVIFGASSLVGRYLAKRLADRGFEGLCLTRRMGPLPYQAPPGFSWDIVPEEGSLRVSASAALFSLAPIPALPALFARIAGGDRMIALSSSSAIFKLESSDPDERDSAQALRRAEKEVQSLCQDRGIGLDDLPVNPDLRSRPRSQYQRDRVFHTAFRSLPDRLARHRTPPADPCRRRGAGYGHCHECRWRTRGAHRPPRRRDIDLPRDGSAHIRVLGTASRPSLSATQFRQISVSHMENNDGCEIQRSEPGADEHGSDARPDPGTRDPSDHLPPISSRVSRVSESVANIPRHIGSARKFRRCGIRRVEFAR